MNLYLSKIRLDGGTQPREKLNAERIGQYADAYRGGKPMPPVSVAYDGADYWLWDGFHRCAAAVQAGLKTIEAEVTQGTQEGAAWLSYGANAGHDSAGLYRSNADKRRAVMAALRHPKGAKLSDRAIAKHVGVGHSVVSELRRLSAVDSQATERTGLDGRTIDTANIGRRGEAAGPTANAGDLPVGRRSPLLSQRVRVGNLIEAVEIQSTAARADALEALEAPPFSLRGAGQGAKLAEPRPPFTPADCDPPADSSLVFLGDLGRDEVLYIVPHVDARYVFCTWHETDCGDGLSFVGDMRGIMRHVAASMAADRLNHWRGPIDRIVIEHAGATDDGNPWIDHPWSRNEMLLPTEADARAFAERRFGPHRAGGAAGA